MPPVPGKGALLGQLETFTAPKVAPLPAKKPPVVRHVPPLGGLPTGPTAKIANPDLGMQQPTGAELPPVYGNLPPGPPLMTLQKFGVSMDMNQLNQNVQEIADAHKKVAGYLPSPGLVYDLVKSQGVTGPVDYSALFGAAHSPRDAIAMSTARIAEHGLGAIGELAPVQQTPDQVVAGLKYAMKLDMQTKISARAGVSGAAPDADMYAIYWWKQNQSVLDAMYADPQQREKLTQAVMKIAPFSPLALKMNPTLTKEFIQNTFAKYKLAEVHRAGLAPPPGVLGFVAKAAGQVGYATTDMPYGFYQLVRGAGLDAFDLSMMGLHTLSPQNTAFQGHPMPFHTAHILGRMGEQVWNDVTHPLRNPGNLLMDVWAAATFGAGAAARASALADATTLGEAARAIAFKRPPETELMGYGSVHTLAPYSETTIVKWLQKYTPYIGRLDRQERMVADQTHGFDEMGTRRITNALFGSTERSVARGIGKSNQIGLAIALTAPVELTRLNNWMSVTRSVVHDLRLDRKQSWKGVAVKQRLGVMSAIRLILSDTIDPVAEWKSYHQNQLVQIGHQRGEYAEQAAHQAMEEAPFPLKEQDAPSHLLNTDVNYRRQMSEFDQGIAQHEAQLQSIDLARQIIENPPARFKPVIDYAHKVAAQKEQYMKAMTGFDDLHANQAIAQIGGALKGQRYFTAADGYRYETDNPNADRVIKQHATAEQRVKTAAARVAREKELLRKNPDRDPAKLKQAIDNQDMHERSLAVRQAAFDALHKDARLSERVVGENGEISNEYLRRDVERLAKGLRMRVHWHAQRGDVRAMNSMNKATDFSLGRVDAVDIGQSEARSMDDEMGILRDTRHGRDNTNNYMAALHELGHQAYKNMVESGDDTPTTMWQDSGQSIERSDSATSPFVRVGHNWAERLLNEEAFAHNWAIEHSAEPLRAATLAQAREWFHSYLETLDNPNGLPTTRDEFRRQQRAGDIHGPMKVEHYGPEIDKLLSGWDDGTLAYGEGVANARMGTPGSAHVGMQTERYAQRNARGAGFQRMASRYGARPPEYPIKAWSGKSLQMGDYRWDVSNLLSEQMKAAYNAYTSYVMHRDLWNSAAKTRISPYHMAIRDIKSVPTHLRDYVEAIERSQADQRFAGLATEEATAALKKWLYPSDDDIKNMIAPEKHIRWVDERFILDKVGNQSTNFWQTVDHVMSGVMGPINNPMRIALIFATPAYALNALGSASLLMMHTGFLAPVTLGRAMHSSAVYGPEATRLIDRLAGQTHASALETERGGFAGRTSHALQNAWGHITDTYFRRAAVIHELRRQGLLKDGNTPDEHLAELQDPAKFDQVNIAAQTARKAMIDYNALSWPERAVLRHVFFVYTFVRNSGIWSLRFLRDHGFMADFLAQSGRDRTQNINDLIGKMPDWFMRSGYFAVHPDQIANPIQWNMPGMLEQIAQPLYSMFGHTPYSSTAELWGPATQFAYEAQTGYDSQGKALPGPAGSGNVEKALIALFGQTAPGLILAKQAKVAKQPPLKPEAVRSSFGNPIAAALSAEKSGLNQSVFQNDGFWNQWGLALFRSGMPRDVNAMAGQARYFRDLALTNPAAYHAHEMDAVGKMLIRQQKVVGEPVPNDVVVGVDTVARVSQAIEDYKIKHRGEPRLNEKQIAMLTLKTLAAEGHVTDKAGWTKKITNATDLTQVKTYQTQLLLQGGGQAWKDWVDKVNAIDNYAQPKFTTHLANISQLGLGDYSAAINAPKEVHWAYGRRSEAFQDQSRALASQVGALTGNARKLALQQWINYVNAQDKEVKINGITFPSPVAYELGSKTLDQRLKAFASWSKKRVSDMTDQQLQILTGSRPDPIVQKGWETLYTWLTDASKNAPLGHPIKAGTSKTYIDYLTAKSPAFKQAYDFSIQPLGARMATYLPIKNSAHADDWNWLLGNANGVIANLRKTYVGLDGKPRNSVVADVWKRYYVPKILPLVQARNKAFLSELTVYTGATTPANQNAYLVKFLGKLASP